jgi:hypothetical protein
MEERSRDRPLDIGIILINPRLMTLVVLVIGLVCRIIRHGLHNSLDPTEESTGNQLEALEKLPTNRHRLTLEYPIHA